MPRKRSEPRPGQVGDYWLSKKPGRDSAVDPWCRTWYDKRERQTCRVSLGTADISAASEALAEWVVLNRRATQRLTGDDLIDEVLLRYWEKYMRSISPQPIGHRLPRPRFGMDRILVGRKTVADITPGEQERFRAALPAREGARDLGPGGIDRILSTGRAALNRAVKYQELASAPFIFMMQTALDRRARDPMGRPASVQDIAALFDAAKSRHLFMFLLVTCCTLFRPGATLDLTERQFDPDYWLVDGNPPGRQQTNKHRPITARHPNPCGHGCAAPAAARRSTMSPTAASRSNRSTTVGT